MIVTGESICCLFEVPVTHSLRFLTACRRKLTASIYGGHDRGVQLQRNSENFPDSSLYPLMEYTYKTF